MGRIIGNRKETEKLYTLVEVNEITNELNAKIIELTEEVEKLTLSNVNLKDENDQLTEANNELNAKIVELTETKETKKSKKDEEKASE